jgi:hypothetical protein
MKQILKNKKRKYEEKRNKKCKNILHENQKIEK